MSASLSSTAAKAGGPLGRITSPAVGLRASRPSNALFVLPFLVVYVLLLLWPLVKGWIISFHDHDLLSNDSFFIGLQNYRELWDDDVFHQVVWNTLRFVMISVPIFVVLSLTLAIALNRPGRLAAVLRAIFFAASVFSVTLITLVWQLALMPGRGMVDQGFAALGLPQLQWLTSDALALPTLALVTVWWIIGLPMMLFLAALQQVPQDIYEAAALDSATRWRTFTSITLPSIRRTVVLVAVIEVILQFQLFGQVQLMTLGGPNNSTRPLVMYIYETGFQAWALGGAAAASQVLFGLMLLAVALQVWLARREPAR